MTQFSWLAYSPLKDGAYCLPCTLFGKNIPNSTTLTNLYIKPFKNWVNAAKVLREHENSCSLHIKSMHSLNMLLSRCNSKANLIEVLIFNIQEIHIYIRENNINVKHFVLK